jgi:hypothetical protein
MMCALVWLACGAGYLRWGVVQQKLGRADEAEKLFQKAIEKSTSESAKAGMPTAHTIAIALRCRTVCWSKLSPLLPLLVVVLVHVPVVKEVASVTWW